MALHLENLILQLKKYVFYAADCIFDNASCRYEGNLLKKDSISEEIWSWLTLKVSFMLAIIASIRMLRNTLFLSGIGYSDAAKPPIQK